jgi:para-aminobenzoate synthetase component I
VATARPSLIRVPLEVPPERLASLIGGMCEPALLESGPGFGDASRWSILAACPSLTFEATGLDWKVERGNNVVESGRGDTLEALRLVLEREQLADPSETPDPDTPPFQGGLIGFLGYDLAPQLERLPRKAARDSRMPDARFGLYDTFVAIDHARGRAELFAEPDSLAAWQEMLTKPPPSIARSRLGPISANVTQREYVDAVKQALEYVAAGDIFQVNLSQRFEAAGEPVPLDLYQRLKTRSPAPFSAFLQWGDLAVVSASPEWFYQTRGDRIVTRPIKGTRWRGLTPREDEALVGELATSAKDRAELTMIVDLERNDLGRVCRYGSVRVIDPHSIESYAQVHHLVATVEGRTRPEIGPVEIVRAMFPGGSITGAPKIRAMQIIDELEPTRRSLYTGAIGYFSRGGASAFNIAIRTMLVEGPRVTYQVGGGIVADSDPESEYHETLHKGRGLRAVIESS